MKTGTSSKTRAAPRGASELVNFIRDTRHPEWVVLAAEAPVEKVSRVFTTAHPSERILPQVPIRAIRKQDTVIAPLVAVVKCTDSSWSFLLGIIGLPIDSRDHESALEDARMLSSKLKTRALAFLGEDTSGAMGYHLYRNGQQIEHKEWDQTETRAPNKAFADLGLYLPVCYPCSGRGGHWLAATSSSVSRVQRADLIKLAEPAEDKEARALLNAVLKNKLPEVRRLLRKGVAPTRMALSEAIVKAAWSGKHDLLKELLKSMSGRRMPFSPAVVRVALSKGHKNPTRRIEVVKLLLAAGADIDGEGGEALRTAIEQEVPLLLKFLLDAGADPNASKSWGSTPLHRAARLGQVECAKLLLHAGAKPDARDEKGETPAQWAAECRHKELAKLLREAAQA